MAEVRGVTAGGTSTGRTQARWWSSGDGDPVAPHVQIHPVRSENEVKISMGVSEPAPDEPSEPSVGVMGTFTPDQIYALADALEGVARCAEEGILASVD
jgi:hypothetical protein